MLFFKKTHTQVFYLGYFIYLPNCNLSLILYVLGTVPGVRVKSANVYNLLLDIFIIELKSKQITCFTIDKIDDLKVFLSICE